MGVPCNCRGKRPRSGRRGRSRLATCREAHWQLSVGFVQGYSDTNWRFGGGGGKRQDVKIPYQASIKYNFIPFPESVKLSLATYSAMLEYACEIIGRNRIHLCGKWLNIPPWSVRHQSRLLHKASPAGSRTHISPFSFDAQRGAESTFKQYKGKGRQAGVSDPTPLSKSQSARLKAGYEANKASFSCLNERRTGWKSKIRYGAGVSDLRFFSIPKSP